MANIVLFDTLLEGIEVIQSDGETFFSALEKMVSTSSQAVDYSVHRLFLVNNIGVFEVDKEGRKFFDIELSQTDSGDIISHIDVSSVDSKLIIGPNSFDIKNRIIMCNSVYHSKKIRIFVDDNNVDRIYLSYRVTVLSPDLRNKLVDIPLLVCDNIVYSNGVTNSLKVEVCSSCK